uniref:Uncharacterized protein n=1 Tax=Trichogramma kaykai TaxID=54128 RepID=A0ABD2XFW6_9HYME
MRSYYYIIRYQARRRRRSRDYMGMRGSSAVQKDDDDSHKLAECSSYIIVAHLSFWHRYPIHGIAVSWHKVY